MTGKPQWRQVFDTVERAVGAPLEDVAASSRFVEIMAVRIRARRAVAGAVSRVVGGAAGTVLHAANMPTRDDIRRLNKNVSALAGEIRALEQGRRAEVVAARPAGEAAENAAAPAPRPPAVTAKDRRPATAARPAKPPRSRPSTGPLDDGAGQ